MQAVVLSKSQNRVVRRVFGGLRRVHNKEAPIRRDYEPTRLRENLRCRKCWRLRKTGLRETSGAELWFKQTLENSPVRGFSLILQD